MNKRKPYIPANLLVLWRYQLQSKDTLATKEEERLLRHVAMRQAQAELELLAETAKRTRLKRKAAKAAAAVTLATVTTLAATCSGGISGSRPPEQARRIEGTLSARVGARRNIDENLNRAENLSLEFSASAAVNGACEPSTQR